MRKVTRIECLGGPVDGKRVRSDGPDGKTMRAFIYYGLDQVPHHYRLCVCAMWDERRPDKLQHATYYHYLGTQYHNADPVLIPHRRKFK